MSTAQQSATLSSDRRLAATIGKNTIFGVVANGAQIGTRLITVPAVLHHLGLGGYGIWSIIMVTAAYMRFGSAGVKSAFQKYVAEATGNGDFGTANRLVSTGSISMLILSVVGLVPAALLSRKMAIASGVPADFLSAAATSISILACIYLVSNFGAAFEAIVMGGHRIDLTRKYNTILTVCESVAIIAVLHYGYGLVAMTLVIGLSELIYIGLCYLASHWVVPEMKISWANFSVRAIPELVRFAGSYQLVNILELIYGALFAVIVLRLFGATAAGAYALASRVVTSFLIGQDALTLPILSGGTMIFASKSTERMRLLLAKAFKATFLTSLIPLAFVAAFGTTLIFVWTGESRPELKMTVWLVSLACLLRAVSLVQLILYRASGKVLLDNMRQVLRIAAIVCVAVLGKRIGFEGVLLGMVIAELIGVVMMFFAMSLTFRSFDRRAFARDAVRISMASALIVGAGAIFSLAPIPWAVSGRWGAAIKLGEMSLGCLIAAWPALMLTKSVSSAERGAMLDLVLRRRRALAAAE